MSQNKLAHSKPMAAYFDQLLAAAGRQFNCYAGQILSGGKARPRNVAAARRWLVAQLRATVFVERKVQQVWIKDKDAKMGGYWVNCRFPFPHIRPDGESNYPPISYPLIAGLLNVDHTAIVRMVRRTEELAAKAMRAETVRLENELSGGAQ